MHSLPSSRRGSALLIVLGLISFLLISAVAFSISMRTEGSAAAAYRRSLLARELLASAFSDARITLDHALNHQRTQAGFNRDNPSTYTVEALAPFKHEGADEYGRLISSYGGEDSVAGLLDDKVMRHVPPYIAMAVYEILESGEGDYDPDATPQYNINAMANWKPIVAAIPENRDAKDAGNDSLETTTTTVGRMAWAVINLSDSLDINAIGSNSAYRGLGFTGSEFAFGTMEANPPTDTLDPWFLENNDPSSSVIDLPTFCSNADLSQYAAIRSSNADLALTAGDYAPFSWENAIATYDDGFYSPFSVYSFWPHMERKDEAGGRIRIGTDGSSEGTSIDPTKRIAANRVTKDSITDADAAVSLEIEDLLPSALGSSAGETVGSNFVRMLLDYIDEDSVPSEFGRNEMTAFSQPTVENTPMVAEVSFDNTGWNKTGYAKAMNEALLESFKKVKLFDEGKTYKTYEEIPDKLEGETFELELAIPSQTVGYRAYFPGVAESANTYTIEVDPKHTILSILGAGEADGKTFHFEGETPAEEIKSASFSIDVDPSPDAPFIGSSMMTMEGNAATKIKIKGEHFPVVKPTEEQLKKGITEQDAQIIRLTFLVDFLFRVQVSNKSGEVVDMAPADTGTFGVLEASAYPKTMSERLNTSPMAFFDAQFFRVTRAVAVEFAFYWEITEQAPAKQGADPTYKAELKWVENLEPRTPDEDLSAEIKIADQPFKSLDNQAPNALHMLSPTDGTWFTVDPRYNWLSPMMGVKDGDFGAYADVSGGQPKLSSPHWLFIPGEALTSGSKASSVQDAYRDKHIASGIVPFKWGLNIEDIRYGTNDSGQLLLPSEVGFLPVPLNTNVWSPSQSSYCTMSLANYYDDVAKASFFRTLPIADLKDGAFTDYDRYTNLPNIFKGMDGVNFPEEHRGIVNVFAGQDNYLLAQRMRQFAMLGIPSTIKQAAFVTRERLTQASAAKRVAPEMIKTDLKALEKLQLDTGLKPPKYDEFIREFLFPLPKSESLADLETARDWHGSQPLYGDVKGTPTRPKTLDFMIDDGSVSFADRITAYNEQASGSTGKLGQNDMTTLLALSKECFGDRQQLFLFVLRADAIRYNTSQTLAQHVPLSTARAVALVWRDAYGELPDRIIYYQYIP